MKPILGDITEESAVIAGGLVVYGKGIASRSSAVMARQNGLSLWVTIRALVRDVVHRGSGVDTSAWAICLDGVIVIPCNYVLV